MKTLKMLTKIALMYALTVVGLVSYEDVYMYGYKGSSVVMLTFGNSGGTGFRIEAQSGNSYIMTNAHVCKINPDKTYLNAWFGNNDYRNLKILEIDSRHDLCVLEDIPRIPSLKLSDSLSQRERVWLIGHPALRPLTLESGHFVSSMGISLWSECEETDKKDLSNIKPEDMDMESLLMLMMGMCTKEMEANHINNISYGGNSGSPVLNKWGNVVGVLFAGNPRHPTASFMVPLKELHRFLEDK